MEARLLTLRAIDTNNSRVSNISVEEFTKLPDKFVSMDEWPKRCNLNCYNCTNHIQHIPLFIPAEVEVTEGAAIERLNKTVYCSPSCVAAVISKMNCNSSDYHMKQLRLLIYRMTGLYIQMIELSDDRAVMDIYGGDVTRKEYKDKVYFANRDYFDAVTKLV